MNRMMLGSLILCSFVASARNDLAAASRISAEGMLLQSQRLKVIAQNISNANTTGSAPEEAPYRRKILKYKRVQDEVLGAEIAVFERVGSDHSDYVLRYEPQHPAADAKGVVKYPNVNQTLEMADAKEAQRSYEANLSALEIAKSNQLKILEALK